jgi:2-polyprenyl-6-methoxyphenol hydroxylase-like FAD-dependent oxidoreductase
MSAAHEHPLDAIVVGAGPVGLALAGELRRHGATCRIVDRAPAPSDKSRAVALHARTLEHLDQLGLAQAFIERGTAVHGVSFFRAGRRTAQLRLDGVDSRYPFAIDPPQSATERLLGDHLVALGGGVERGVELVGLETEGDGVTCTLRHPDGRREELRARYVCGCDGAHSTVRVLAGIPFAGRSYGEQWILADVRIQTPAFARDEVTIYAEPHHFVGVFPLPDERWRLLAMRGAATHGAPAQRATLEEFEALLLHHTRTAVRLFDPAWISPFRIGRRHATRLRDGPVFLCGDAAHAHSHISGQGMNTGLQDAINLGWKLGLVCSGRARPELLDTYEVERLPVIKRILAGTDVATRAVTIRHAAAQDVVYALARLLLGLAPVRDRLTRNITELQINYRGRGCVSALHDGRAGRRRAGLRRAPRPGDHAPSAPHLQTVPEGRQVRLYDLIRHPGHTVVLLEGEQTPSPPATDVTALAAALRDRFGDEVRPLAVRAPDGGWSDRDLAIPLAHDRGGEMHRAYHAALASIYLIRPDGYLGFRSGWADRQLLLEFLETYLVGSPADAAGR